MAWRAIGRFGAAEVRRQFAGSENRIRVEAGLPAHFLREGSDDGSHFRQGVASLLRRDGPGNPAPEAHHAKIPDEEPRLEGLIAQSGAVLAEISENTEVAFQRLTEPIRFGLLIKGAGLLIKGAGLRIGTLAIRAQQQNTRITKPIAQKN
ncbi:MAG TPA: hypothetical protein VKV17_21655 [Bryobacteraceae bacterium]|nr:hypothetical protein [Bryobacteraceae bacterium]